jgi:hypothetical protein
VDVYGVLADKNVDTIFYRTDHHWTQLGAYYAANAILTAAKKDPLDITRFTPRKGNNYLGILYAKYQAKSLEAHPDELYYYTDDHNPIVTICYHDQNGSHMGEEKMIDPSRAGYFTFISRNDFEYAVVPGKNKQGGNLLMVSDSFGYVLTIWLAERFNTVVLIEPRYFQGGKKEFQELLSKYQITDFMLSQCAMSVVPYFTEQINILSGATAERR